VYCPHGIQVGWALRNEPTTVTDDRFCAACPECAPPPGSEGTMSDRVELIRRYSQGVETPDYHTLLTDAALMAIEYEAERALTDDLAAALMFLLEHGEDTGVDDVLARYREARGR
jgi:hypothetical protein